jgi:hypothetical protein
MRPSKIILAAVFSLAFTWAAAASATTYANFSGNCNRTSGSPGPAFCLFDGTQTYNNGHTSDTTATTCGSSTVSAVYWDFGDGTGTWDDLTTAHTYSDPAAIDNDTVITMTVFCADSTWDDKTRYLLFIVVGPGDMYCNAGWN